MTYQPGTRAEVPAFPAQEAWLILELEASFELALWMMQNSSRVFIFLGREVEGRTPEQLDRMPGGITEQDFLPSDCCQSEKRNS